MTVCVFVSDLHTRDIDPPEGDLLINCGDMTFRGKANEVHWYKNWLKKQRPKYKEIVWIAGNHDFNADYWGDEIAEETNTIYLENSGCEVLGLKIWGSPITPTFYNWAFMKDRGSDIRSIWKLIPKDLDLLMCHGPAYGILDTTPFQPGEHVGCQDLLDAILNKKPRYFAHGHLHDPGGQMVVGDHTTFINAAICDEEYNPTNKIQVLEI